MNSKQYHFACCVDCYCSNTVSWITWSHRRFWLAAVYLKNALNDKSAYLILTKCFTPRFRTAGFGVFAGRAFNKHEELIESWMTLFLPKNFPRGCDIWYYCFDHNDTHVALPLDYGSLLNHHKSSNTLTRSGINDNVHFQV